MSAPVAVVTGCSKGTIGFALCEAFAAQGCTVYATARRPESMEGFQHENIHTLKLDVTDEAEVQSVVKTILDKEGKIDIVVNNAGVACAGPLSDVPADVVAATFSINVLAPLHMYRAVFPHMASRRVGTIINVGSISSVSATPWLGVYSATKAAIERISEVQYMEALPFNVSVMHVTPGLIKSNMNATTLSQIHIAPDSIYSGWLGAMRDLSKTDGTPTDVFARRVVSSALEAHPPRHVILGKMSTTVVWISQSFPRGWLLRRMWDLAAGKPKPKVD